jgi:hypothetical protein
MAYHGENGVHQQLLVDECCFVNDDHASIEST